MRWSPTGQKPISRVTWTLTVAGKRKLAEGKPTLTVINKLAYQEKEKTWGKD